jgi:ketosteroid isomerase-like protein
LRGGEGDPAPPLRATPGWSARGDGRRGASSAPTVASDRGQAARTAPGSGPASHTLLYRDAAAEVASLNRSDIADWRTDQAIVTGKGDKERTVFFDQPTLAALRAYLVERADSYEPLVLRQEPARGKSKNHGQNWVEVFAAFQRPLGHEIRGLTISMDGDVAFVHSLNWLSGTLNNGNRSGFWIRATLCWRKIDGNWLVAHDHVSVPLESGRALLNLEP